jgi:hypothetical protein
MLVFSILSVLCAVVAAGFWGYSAIIKLPKISGSYVEIHNLEPFYSTLKKIALCNAFAAAAALCSAIFQAVTMYLAAGH